MSLMPQAETGVLSTGELGLPVTKSGLYLPAGASARWQRRDTLTGENK